MDCQHLFGLMHALNGFLTGEFGPANIQAVMAFFSGIMFMGLRLRQNSPFPVMLVHGLWDFSVFSRGQSPLALVGPVFPIILFIHG